ncbi:peroxiredoxin-like family protein [Litoreibacter albidus]|uniref:peroxiredoxin-like family protein n=1 Tax=Litoreibacter albidus TaxID=670155 RepID=UPI003734FC01
MTNPKLTAGGKFPDITLPTLGGGTANLTATTNDSNWKLILVYRGKHCPLCTKQLKELKDYIADFKEAGVDVIAVSGDDKEKATAQLAEIEPNYDVAYDLSIEQMQSLGLYISDPRSPQETDHPFAEPALFVVNADGHAQFINIANAPFLRPDFKSVLSGIGFVRNPDNNYPIRGTRAYA